MCWMVGWGHEGALRDSKAQLYWAQVLESLVKVVQFGPGFWYMDLRKQVDQSSCGAQSSGEVRFQLVRKAVSWSLV